MTVCSVRARTPSWLYVGLLFLVGACAQAPKLELRAPVILLGEVHDNATQHALRLEAFKALLATGARPALLMEQFDRSQQTIIDSQRQGNADGLIHAAKTGSGWQWGPSSGLGELALCIDQELPMKYGRAFPSRRARRFAGRKSRCLCGSRIAGARRWRRSFSRDCGR